jgi:small subunit ribosomal protein S20
VTDALTHKHAEEAETAFRDACKLLDREADRGLIHRKAAARRKSRLQRKINQLKSAGAS